MNILAAILFATVSLMGYGVYVDVPTVQELASETSPAALAGIEPGDVLHAINGVTIENYEQTSDLILGASGEEMAVTVERGGVLVDLTVRDFYNEAEGRNLIGITYGYGRERYGLFRAMGTSFRYVWDIFAEVARFIGSIFTQGVKQGDVVGPVGTVTIIGQAVRTGFETVLYLSVLISVNLAFMNLLPLPALDGGRLVFLLIEAIRRKPVPPEKEGMVHFAGLVLLLGLMVYLTVSDVRGLFSGLFGG